ncbi:prothoracicostatic peptide isoform X3 [Adelges cooleyi]|nr:prothoracicostatic peptide isoform X3 [Adelges cooleyi]XP_050428911.1 prothoracicostatic peptide isoform X3 [Adelges cooleyi]XP_050428912.1 prothoracicostatic peptide isoform X3 [Adelges cooleyi]
MQNVLGNIAATLVILCSMIVVSIQESAVQSSLKTNQNDQDNLDYTRSFDEDQEEKRAWRDLQAVGWGKRSWQNLKSTWGKRSHDWQNLRSSWGKRQGWQKLQSGWGKRGWNNMQSGGWGKRSNDQILNQFPQNEEYTEKNDDDNSAEIFPQAKRSWDTLQGSWGKRAADWTSFRGSWGKRSQPLDYLNDYSSYRDDIYKAYNFPPGYSNYLSNYKMEIDT